MDPKILIVLGSPRKKGNSATLAAMVAEGAIADGADVETVYLVNALRSFQDICRYLGANIEGMVYGSASSAGEIKQKQDVMEKAVLLGKHLATIRMKQASGANGNFLAALAIRVFLISKAVFSIQTVELQLLTNALCVYYS